MRILLLTLFVFLPTSVAGQKASEWQRAYTFDDSFIDMNTRKVILGGDIGRVTFRWTFNQPEQLSSNSKYKSRIEVIEFRCSDKRFRMYEVIFLDSSGKTIHSEIMKSPYEWHALRSDVMRTIFGTACELIEARLNPVVRPNAKSDDELELDRAYEFVRSIRKTLARSRNFQLIVNNFFTHDFIKRYLDDDDSTWFFNLTPDTASKASYAELKRFYVAQLNAGYLTSLYLISQTMAKAQSPDEPVIEKTIPADIYRLINRHSYTLTYKAKTTGYDFLAENVDSIARMRSYTDLLERVAVLMREHVRRVYPESSQQDKNILEDSDLHSRVCTNECLGLPKGTKLFELTMPPLRLQFAKIKGAWKVISATDSSR